MGRGQKALLATINLNETLVLGDRGNTHSGSFTLDFYDPSGNFMFEVTGTDGFPSGQNWEVDCAAFEKQAAPAKRPTH